MWFYWQQGINILPAKEKEKFPDLPEWKKYQSEFTNKKQIETWLMEGKFQNIFAPLGNISNNITEIDIDVPNVTLEDIFSNVKEAKKKLWIAESSMEKKKIYCKGERIGPYDDKTVSNKEYEKPDGKKTKPHVEYMGNNKGTILPPSIHYTGVQYKWLNLEKGKLPELEIIDTEDLYNRIVKKLQTKYNYVESTETVTKEVKKKRKKRPRYCFTEAHDSEEKWDKQQGHDFRTAIGCELINCNYINDEILDFFKSHDEISGEPHDAKLTVDHIERIRRKKMFNWGCKKLQQKCSAIVNKYCDACPKIKKEDISLYVSSFELPDGKYLEEIIVEGIEQFVLYDKKTDKWEIINDYLYGDIPIKPYPLGPEEREAIILPDGVEEYGTLSDLLKEMHDFSLEEYDPVDNPELYELTINLFLATWVSPIWQRGMAEKFIPIINPRGPSETGKKRFLTIARWLTYHSLYGLKTNRVPTLFRALAPIEGTLILDEADMGDSSLSSELVEFLNSRCDGVPIPRYSTDSKKTDWWKSFGMTILATRRGFSDDGLESRCTVMPTATTDNPEKYHLIPPDDWLEKGKVLQRKLLLFKLRHLDGKMPTQLIIKDISSFRVREALLVMQGLKDEDPSLLKKIKELALILQDRIIKERAASPEGLLLNIVYGNLIDEKTHLERDGIGYIIVREYRERNPDDSGEYKTGFYPISLKNINKSLGEAFSSSEIAKMWRGLNQDTLSQKRVDGKRYRGVLKIKNLKRLDKIFPKYVPDYEQPIIFENEGLKQTSLGGKE